MADILYIVVPCYNEQEVLYETAKRLSAKLQTLIKESKISPKSRILFVNDGSLDGTWAIIEKLHENSQYINGINLTRNRGHQNALLAGLSVACEKADLTISMDADLQDDIDAVDKMLDKYYDGCDIVYGVRKSRKNDSFFKKITAEGFYRLMNFLGAQTVFNHADYRLMSKRAVKNLEQFNEVNLFLRGIIPMIGYKSDIVYYDRKKRFAGKSKYPLRKMLHFAAEGITSFSTKPIRYITLIGSLIFIVSIIMIIAFIIDWGRGNTVSGWASIICSIWAIGGLIMLSLGIIGEYIGKMYLETKKRPRYIIEKVLDDEEPTK
ncbi:MAG: glycosyltransferase family 2 protein [Clostridia bacterium]|nr:glycosyltransferase family 2 protein [Clostridia bacterium]MBP3705896.1 glycosyltransferase family 2 protein [Clostridia bacterium]